MGIPVKPILQQLAQQAPSEPSTEGTDVTDDDYPTEEELRRIETWDHADPEGWMMFIKSVWHMPDWGWSESEEGGKRLWSISTGGWSGNEDIVESMSANLALWGTMWVQSRRGGHYQFERVLEEQT